MTGLLLIATGPSYMDYIRPLLASAKEYFVEHTPILWTDTHLRLTERQFHLADQGYPNTTLRRYHTFLEHAEMLREFDQLFYCDIDMKFVAPITGEEIFSDGITATTHPGFARERRDLRSGDWVSNRGTPERRAQSTAYIGPFEDNKYFCGGFNGGDAKAYLRMADTIRWNIDADKRNDIIAKWHDESHLNRYLYNNPPAKVLTPSFCYPEDYDGGYGWGINEFEPKLIALDKSKRR